MVFLRSSDPGSQSEEEFGEGAVESGTCFVDQDCGAIALFADTHDCADIGGRIPGGQVRGILQEIVQAR